MSIESTIKGAFKGFKHGARFELINGQVWEQVDATYQYQYLYRPDVKIDDDGIMTVDEMDGEVCVRLARRR